MHVQNLMNSLRDIRIFLGLVPKESPCIPAPFFIQNVEYCQGVLNFVKIIAQQIFENDFCHALIFSVIHLVSVFFQFQTPALEKRLLI